MGKIEATFKKWVEKQALNVCILYMLPDFYRIK